MVTKETFFEKVYSIVSNIPKGKVLSYGRVAALAGSSGASRAVGTAMRRNKDMKTVPCHRVVGSDGRMHGYAFGSGISLKIRKLKREGVAVENGKIDLARYMWNV